MLPILAVPALVFVSTSTWTEWMPLATDSNGQALVSYRLRQGEEVPGEGVRWVLNLRNHTDKNLAIDYQWSLGGTAQSDSRVLEPEQMQDARHVFPKVEGGTPEVTLINWEFRETEAPIPE